MRKLLLLPAFLCLCLHVCAQPQTREELEKQRQQLKKEIEQTEQMLNANKTQTKESLLQWRLINNKVNLQDRVIDNISRDLKLINDNIYLMQRDIYRYDRALDTLKQEYAKSMVYAYKNRSNYDFLNFLFSASSFNDAMKRITYLKSYRSYREMQGEQIFRTQELRRQKIADLSQMKGSKTSTLEIQSNEMSVLAAQKKEKDIILSQLRKQGKELNRQISAKQAQMKKVNNAINAAIKRAIAEERERERKRIEAEKAKEREAERLAALAAANKPAPKPSGTNPAPKPVIVAAAKPAPAEKRASVLLNDDNVALNASFEKNRGSLPWPVDRGLVLMHYGSNKLPSGSTLETSSITVSSEVGSPVKAVFDGTVSTVTNVEDMQVVIIQHGRYFSTYSNLSGVSVSRGQQVKTGQLIGKVAVNLDGVGSVDLYISNENSNFYDPESWLRRR